MGSDSSGHELREGIRIGQGMGLEQRSAKDYITREHGIRTQRSATGISTTSKCRIFYNYIDR